MKLLKKRVKEDSSLNPYPFIGRRSKTDGGLTDLWLQVIKLTKKQLLRVFLFHYVGAGRNAFGVRSVVVQLCSSNREVQTLWLSEKTFGFLVIMESLSLSLNRWQYNDRMVDLTREHYSMVGGNLEITNPEKSRDEGKYFCIATNTHGSVRSREGILNFGCKHYLSFQ